MFVRRLPSDAFRSRDARNGVLAAEQVSEDFQFGSEFATEIHRRAGVHQPLIQSVMLE